MTRKTWAFEDFVEGTSIDLGSKDVTAQEIVEFAGEFDPQPMHLDEASGRASILGGLSASGWHTCAIFMRLFCDSVLLHSTSQGAPGVDHIKWRKPVLAGDRLDGRAIVVAARPSRSRSAIGLVTLRSQLSNQRGETVLELENAVMFRKREAAT